MQLNLPPRSSNPVAINMARGKSQTTNEIAVTKLIQIVALKGNKLKKYLAINISFLSITQRK